MPLALFSWRLLASDGFRWHKRNSRKEGSWELIFPIFAKDSAA